MRLKRKELPNSGLIAAALATFLATAFTAILVNSSIMGHGFHLEYSISHYVGLETWSAVMFTIGNFFVAAFFGVYLWRLGEAWGMPRLFYYLIVVMVVGLLMLSFCPSGYFDVEGGSKNLITWIHEISSRTMFIAMMLMAALIAVWKKAGAMAHAVCVAYVVYAIICIAGYFTQGEWFVQELMIYETVYLASFMIMLALCGVRDVPEAKQLAVKSKN